MNGGGTYEGPGRPEDPAESARVEALKSRLPVSLAVVRCGPALTGTVLPARPAKVSATVELENGACVDCKHLVGGHGGDDGCAECWCHLSLLEAAGWTSPGDCAGGCR